MEQLYHMMNLKSFLISCIIIQQQDQVFFWGSFQQVMEYILLKSCIFLLQMIVMIML